jgi:Uma2 family endonuclease
MSTVTTPAKTPDLNPLFSPNGERLLTAADVAVLPSTLPTGGVCYELYDGKLILMSPPGFRHGRVGSQIAALLFLHGEKPGHGVGTDEVGILLRRNPDTLVGADVTFIAAKSLPVRLSPEGYLETIPELVVEVRSKNDTGPEVEAKVREYLAAGVELVWVADPDARTVTAHRPDQPPRVFADADTLTADPVIPGFAVPVADLFRT